MKGLDISFSKPSAQWWQDRKAEGYGIAVQCVWTGGFASNEGIKAAAETNLRNARLAGFRVAVYANASPPDWWPLVTQMQNIRANMGGEWDRVNDVVIDVEIPGITEARVMELADGLEAVGKIADVLYTGRWFWTGHMGNSKDIAWRRFRLWSAHYDWNPDINFGDNPYGPWTLAEVIGEQYAGSTDVAGGTIDVNTFKDSWMEDDMDDEATIRGWIRDAIVAHESSIPHYAARDAIEEHEGHGEIHLDVGQIADNLPRLNAHLTGIVNGLIAANGGGSGLQRGDTVTFREGTLE